MKKFAYLFFVLIISGMVPITYAASSDDLLRIALEADQQISVQINSVYGSSIPSEIQTLYNQGHQSVIKLQNSFDENTDESKENFLLALKSFKQISKFIQKSSSEPQTNDNHNYSYYDEIQRLEKYTNSLKAASQKLDNTIDFTLVDNLIFEIKQKISNNDDNIVMSINELKSLINSIKEDIHETSTDKNQNKFINFIENQLNKFENRLDEISNDESNSVKDIRSLIIQTRELISEKNIDEAKIIFKQIVLKMKNI